ncbi:MAG TPA: alpha/beta hydrolase-fold protein [Phycisphaerales bacterium]|nr:alpha/beta hydrolase-fold protein [Phycisphaerales bacterium]
MLTTFLTLTLAASFAADPTFTVTLDPKLQTEPYSGRVYVVMVKGSREPRKMMSDWFSPPQVFSLDVDNRAAGTPIDVSSPAFSFPKSMTDLPGGTYTIQGVARRSREHYAPGEGEGDLYSKPQEVTWPPAAPVSLVCDQAVPAYKFRESATVKLFTVKSKLLSDFHGRDITLRAGVALPRGWAADSKETWPAVYFIGGFGGSHRETGMISRLGGSDQQKVITIVPDPTNYWGHCVFADSANTGPWGRAFVEELIPAVEKQFRGPAGAPDASAEQAAARRYVTGISSGGWSSLWLQVSYPDAFAGCWSHSPDPVDFRDFQRIDLYAAGTNMYVDAQGGRRPIARNAGKNVLFYKEFVAMESALGPGGQIQSFEAVFSPKGDNGLPRQLFDRATGTVDANTARAWEAYDISLKLRRDWKTLGPKLTGKLHVYGGSADNFFLEGAVEKLQATLKEVDPENTAKAVVEIIPGMGHAIHEPAQEGLFKAAAATAPAK